MVGTTEGSDAFPLTTIMCCLCRVGHDNQWTNSKAAGTSGPDVETLFAAWNCAISFDVHGNPTALHLGVYAAQPHQAHDSVDRSSSFLSVVSWLLFSSCDRQRIVLLQCSLVSLTVHRLLSCISHLCSMLAPLLSLSCKCCLHIASKLEKVIGCKWRKKHSNQSSRS